MTSTKRTAWCALWLLILIPAIAGAAPGAAMVKSLTVSRRPFKGLQDLAPAFSRHAGRCASATMACRGRNDGRVRSAEGPFAGR